MLFTKVGTVILLVSDMAKSTKFYKDTLELPIKTKASDWVEFFARETTLASHPLKSKRKNIKPIVSSRMLNLKENELIIPVILWFHT